MSFSEIPENEKKEYFREWGWHLTLFDKKGQFPSPHHPFMDLRIYWSEEENDKVLDYANTMWFFDSECKAEDISIFTNQMSTPCHNPSVGLRDDSQLADRLITEGIGWVSISDPEDIEILMKKGLQFEFGGDYSRIGKVVKKEGKSKDEVCVDIDDKPGFCFIPQKIMNIPSADFRIWLQDQNRFVLQEMRPDLSELDACCDFIKGQD